VTSVVFWGSSDGVFSNRHYAALVESGARIAAVVDVPPGCRSTTNAARPSGGSFVEHAKANGIPVYDPEKPNAPEFVERVRALAPDLFIAVGYMLLMKGPLLAVPRLAAANFHASLLPAYRGKHPVFWALRHGEKWCGLTVHHMGEGLDTGDIIFQVRVPVRAVDSVATLYDRVTAESVPLVGRLVKAAEAGCLPRTPQREEEASYYGATKEDDFRLDWSHDASELARWVTASPGQCFAVIGGKKLFLLDAAVLGPAPGDAPGRIRRAEAGACEICARGGALAVREMRTAGGRFTSAREALREAGCAEGAVLAGAQDGGA
jgi:methionyl-tRNA formyltransferase